MSLIFQKTLQNVGQNLTIRHNDQFILGEIQERAILVVNSVKYIVQYEMITIFSIYQTKPKDDLVLLMVAVVHIYLFIFSS